MNEQIEQKVLRLIALDRLHAPVSSMEGKFKRRQEKIANSIELEKSGYRGERVHAKIVVEDQLKTRRIGDAVAEFCEKYPEEGKILTQIIEDERSESETHLYFGMNTACKLTAEDYIAIMMDLGMSEAQARALYQPLMDYSRTLAKQRQEGDRSLTLG